MAALLLELHALSTHSSQNEDTFLRFGLSSVRKHRFRAPQRIVSKTSDQGEYLHFLHFKYLFVHRNKQGFRFCKVNVCYTNSPTSLLRPVFTLSKVQRALSALSTVQAIFASLFLKAHLLLHVEVRK